MAEKVYTYDPETGEYIGEHTLIDSKDGVTLVNFSTTPPPIETVEGEKRLTPRWIKGKWELAEPHQKVIDRVSAELKDKRDYLLRITERYIIVPDLPITAEQKQAILDFRRAVRDTYNNSTDPFETKFPDLPELPEE